MSPLLPAVQARQAERHPALDVGIKRNPFSIDPSPGARNTLHLDRRWDEYDDDPDALPPVEGLPVTTPVRVSPVVETPTIFQDLPSSNYLPTSTYPAVGNSLDTSSSSLPSTTTSTLSTATPRNTGLSFQGPRFGSTVLPAMVAFTPSAHASPVLAGEAENHPGGLSGGAIAAIVIVILLAMGALAFFLLRGRLIQKRTARRATWTANAWQRPTVDASSSEKDATEIHPKPPPDIVAAANAPSTPRNEGGASQPQVLNIPRKSPPPYIRPTGEAPVTQLWSHNSPVYSSAPSPQPSAVRAVTSMSTQDMMALVRVTFVPQLPDELAITPGETVYIRTEFDDGWALCSNTRGEQGMVPLECLEGEGGQFTELALPSVNWQNRDSRRVSSLRSPVT